MKVDWEKKEIEFASDGEFLELVYAHQHPLRRIMDAFPVKVGVRIALSYLWNYNLTREEVGALRFLVKSRTGVDERTSDKEAERLHGHLRDEEQAIAEGVKDKAIRGWVLATTTQYQDELERELRAKKATGADLSPHETAILKKGE